MVERDISAAIQATGCKYIAICEGDDYWTDSLKLQKQVDILEADESLIGVFTDSSEVDAVGNVLKDKIDSRVPSGKHRLTLRDFFQYNPMYPTATVVYRNNHQAEKAPMYEHTRNPFLGDWTSWIILHIFGDFYYLDEVTSAYRINPTSLTHTVKRVERAKATWDICNSVADILPSEYDDIIRHLRDRSWNYINVAHAYRKEHQYLQALRYMLISCIKAPKITLRHLLKLPRNTN